MAHLGLSARIILLLQIAMGFALVSTILLFYFKMQGLVEDTVSSRYAVVSGGVAHEIEQALGLGLKLTELKNVDAIIRRELSRERRITSLTLFTDHGEIVTSAGAAALNGRLPIDWLRALHHDPKPEQHAAILAARGSQIVISAIEDPFGGIAGGVALTYPLMTARARIHRTIPTIILGGLVCLVVSLGVTMIAVWLAVRPTRQRIHQTALYLENLAAGIPRPIPPAALELAPGLDQFAATIAAARATPGGAGGTSGRRRPPQTP